MVPYVSMQQNFNLSSLLKIQLMSGVLIEDGQAFTIPKTEHLEVHAPKIQTDNTPHLTITGPRTVPQCGEFLLISHLFTSKGGKVNYKWDIKRADNQCVEPSFFYEVTGQTTPYVRVLAENLQLGLDYKFVLVVTLPTQSLLTAAHTVTRVAYNAPIVSVYSSTLLPGNILNVNQQLQLFAETFLPDCIKLPKPIRFAWALDNPHVRFDFSRIYFPIYKADPFTLP
ncbi:uncharacterized protein LOC111084005, partial [Limulus polyphemus]|uniref:Uncharacterized protein LOC111084005 n=1 Tax=Limulus polyphemus TaxID=6850 RepID=A0ABM1RYM5_LIMPO